MRKLFLHINVTLDGYIEDTNGEIDWHFSDGEFEAYLTELLRSIDGMIFGRVSHELLATYWPTAATNPGVSAEHIEMAKLMRRLPKYVITRGSYGTDWENSHVLRGDVSGAIRELKAQAGKDMALFAGAGAAQSLMAAGLVDEYRFIVNPVLLGSGTALFGERDEREFLTLTDVRRFESGAVVLTYEPKG